MRHIYDMPMQIISHLSEKQRRMARNESSAFASLFASHIQLAEAISNFQIVDSREDCAGPGALGGGRRSQEALLVHRPSSRMTAGAEGRGGQTGPEQARLLKAGSDWAQGSRWLGNENSAKFSRKKSDHSSSWLPENSFLPEVFTLGRRDFYSSQLRKKQWENSNENRWFPGIEVFHFKSFRTPWLWIVSSAQCAKYFSTKAFSNNIRRLFFIQGCRQSRKLIQEIWLLHLDL